MRLGISFNLFDGEELLESSIKLIRNQVDHINVVYQTISNFGNPCNEDLVPLLERLKSEGLIDELFEYKPIVRRLGHFNEITKRNIGLAISENANCTHHMAMDSDEFYTEEQFEYIKKTMLEGDYDSSVCQMATYYKDSKHILDPKEEYYVSLIYKIRKGKDFVMMHPFPVLVDPTRRMEPGKCKIFTRDEVEMHHMSYVRKNLFKKLQNSSASPNFIDINKIVNYFNNWEYPNRALVAGAPDKFYNIKKTENNFKTWG